MLQGKQRRDKIGIAGLDNSPDSPQLRFVQLKLQGQAGVSQVSSVKVPIGNIIMEPVIFIGATGFFMGTPNILC